MRFEPPFVLPPRAEAALARIGFDRAVLVLASVPMLMGPPVAAIILALCFRQNRSAQTSSVANLNTALLVATVNIVLSIMLWRYLVAHVGSSVLDILQTIKTFPLVGSDPSGSQKI